MSGFVTKEQPLPSTVKLIHGDCLDVLRKMKDKSVDAVVTDPPYGTGQWQRPEAGAGRDCSAVYSSEEWDIWDTAWLDEAWRVSGGCVGLFCAQWNLPSLFDWCAATHPWRLGFWRKTDPRPRFAGQPAFSFECFVGIGRREQCGGKDIVSASAPRANRDYDGTGHPHQKPKTVMTWAVDWMAARGMIVLDPFMGSGTTGVACVMTGRSFIGIEIDDNYFKIAERRIKGAPRRA